MVPRCSRKDKELGMRRLVLGLVLAALFGLTACAQRDPNLRVRGLEEFGKAPGGYTLTLKTYELDGQDRVRLAAAQDPSLTGFAARALAARGYRAAGPAAYSVEAHLLCVNPRKARLGLRSEEIRIPAEAVGRGYHDELHFWLPGESSPGAGRESMDRRDALVGRRARGTLLRGGDDPMSGTPYARPADASACQGRVLLLVSPVQAGGGAREVFAAQGATADCAPEAGCPVDTCRAALEDVLVNMIESGL